MTKVVHKNVCNCCDKIKNSKSKIITQPLSNTQVIYVTLKVLLHFEVKNKQFKKQKSIIKTYKLRQKKSPIQHEVLDS